MSVMKTRFNSLSVKMLYRNVSSHSPLFYEINYPYTFLLPGYFCCFNLKFSKINTKSNKVIVDKTTGLTDVIVIFRLQ